MDNSDYLTDVTRTTFRRLALALPDSVESSHMQHPDFRVGGKIFATLDAPSAGWAMVKVSPAVQRRLQAADPATFTPAAGAWGRAGSTLVRLRTAQAPAIRRALREAWRLRAPAALRDAFDGD
jgi:hypothetical protein